MMMKRQDSQETLSSLPPPTYESPDTVTPPNRVASTAMTPESVYQNTVGYNPVLPSPPMHNQSENATLDHELRSKLYELVHQISKEDLTSSDDEPIQKVIDRRYDGAREKENDRVRHRKRNNEAQKESNGKTEMERNKRKMERLSERWIERQVRRECEEIDVVRQRHKERDQKREGNDELVRLMEKHQNLDRQQKTESQRQVERNWQVRQVETESENEREAEKMKPEETEPHMLARVNGLSMRRDLQENETQQVTINTEKAKDGWVDIKKSVEEEHSEKGLYLTEEKVNQGLLQRSNSERGSEKRAEPHNHSAPIDPEEQMSQTEVRRKSTEPESVDQFECN